MKKQKTERLQQLAGIKPLYQLNEMLDMDQAENMKIGDVYLYRGDDDPENMSNYSMGKPITLVRSLGIGPDGVEQFSGEMENGTSYVVTRFDLNPIPDSEDSTDNSIDKFNQSTKTITGLADLFLNISKGLRKGEYKGIQAGEIDEIDDLLTMVLQAAEETNITSVIKRLEGMLGNSLKI